MKIRRWIVLLTVFVSSLFLTTFAYSATVKVPETVKQGGIYVVGFSGDENISHIRGIFAKKNAHFNPTPYPGTYSALFGVDVAEEVGPELFRVVVTTKDGMVYLVDKEIMVAEADFGIQRIRVPKKWVNYDNETEKRIQLETESINEVLRGETEMRLWDTPFIRPAAGRISAGFGLKRYINGIFTNTHSGIDIVAYLGTPVLAANSGVVQFVEETFIWGKIVIINHGQGLFSTYCHLSKILVEVGEAVERGHEIGLIGGTGRVTGVHLHYGITLNSNVVNPLEAEKISLDKNCCIFISR
jgi:Peptidase family M23